MPQRIAEAVRSHNAPRGSMRNDDVLRRGADLGETRADSYLLEHRHPRWCRQREAGGDANPCKTKPAHPRTAIGHERQINRQQNAASDGDVQDTLGMSIRL